jgi:hypothetical protein
MNSGEGGAYLRGCGSSAGISQPEMSAQGQPEGKPGRKAGTGRTAPY